ncbi:MAG: hypothetical protein DMF59_12595 [Acidobacteria bacterium]|nr:MAG: hypothetical protein DMF59_12595 [Acidobacteriota bacterium]
MREIFAFSLTFSFCHRNCSVTVEFMFNRPRCSMRPPMRLISTIRTSMSAIIAAIGCFSVIRSA